MLRGHGIHVRYGSSSTDLFEAPPSPNNVQFASSPQVRTSRMVNPSHLTTPYRIDNKIKNPQRPASNSSTLAVPSLYKLYCDLYPAMA